MLRTILHCFCITYQKQNSTIFYLAFTVFLFIETLSSYIIITVPVTSALGNRENRAMLMNFGVQ